MLDELKRRAKGGTRVTMSMAGPALTFAAWKLFGKFSKACRVAGLEVHTVKRRRVKRRTVKRRRVKRRSVKRRTVKRR